MGFCDKFASLFFVIILESLRGIFFFSGLRTLSAEATLEKVKSASFILIILTWYG